MSKPSKLTAFTSGGQITFHSLRMWKQVIRATFKFSLLAYVLLVCLLTWWLIGFEKISNTIIYLIAKGFALAHVHHTQLPIRYEGHWYHESVQYIVSSPYYPQLADRIGGVFLLILLGSLIFAVTLIVGSWCFFAWRGRSAMTDEHISGSKLVDAKVFSRAIQTNKDEHGRKLGVSDIHMDDIHLPHNFEVRGILNHGTTGSGKSQALMKLLDQIRERGDKAIIADSGGLFTKHYYQETDAMLSANDRRADPWDIWLEGDDWSDYGNLAKGYIPQSGNDPFWSQSARMLFASALDQMRSDPDRSYNKLLRLLFQADLKDVSHYFADTDASLITNMSIQKTTTCIRTLLAVYLKSLRLLPELKKGEAHFSIRQWITDDSDRRWVFLPFQAKDKEALTPLISSWLDLACLYILSATEDDKRRIWFVIDELPTFQALPSLDNVAEVRKFGGCFVIGVQSIEQMLMRYGGHRARAILDNLNTHFYFRSNLDEVASWVSKQIGTHEIIRTTKTISFGANHIRDGVTINKTRKVEPLLSATQISGMPDLAAIIKTFGNDVPRARTSFRHQKREQIAAEHLPRAVSEDKELAAMMDSYAKQYPLLEPLMQQPIKQTGEPSVAVKADEAPTNMSQKEAVENLEDAFDVRGEI